MQVDSWTVWPDLWLCLGRRKPLCRPIVFLFECADLGRIGRGKVFGAFQRKYVGFMADRREKGLMFAFIENDL